MIASTALVYSPFLHVLLSPVTISYCDPATLNYRRLDSALDAFRFAYVHTVIDAARLPVHVAATLAAASRAALLVFQMNVKELTAARAILDGLARHDVPIENVLCVANRYQRRGGMIELQEAEEALGRSITTVSNDFGAALGSVNCGQPLAQAAPRSPLRRAVQKLAERFVNSHTEAYARND